MIDTIGWDCYNQAFVQGLVQRPGVDAGHAPSPPPRRAGVNWAVAELGSKMASGDSGAGRAAWLTAIGSYARANGAAYVTYFDSTVGGDFRLLDAASKDAWRQVIAG